MTESTPLSNTYPLFRMFLTNAGVNLDRASGKTVFFSDSRGEVYVCATTNELDAIEKFLQPLAGVPLTHGTFHISPETLAKATHTLPREISTLLATNAVAGLQALLESFDPSDPRPKRVQYKPETGEITARATEADLKKFEAALNPNGQELANLVNRSFRADPNMMAQALGIIPKVIGSAGLQTNELVLTQPITAATNAAQIKYAVSNTFKAIGVDLNPALGKTFLYNDHGGTILVRATDKELDLIEAYIAKNTTFLPSVNIKIRWLKIPQSLAFELFRPNLTNTSLPPILRSPEPSVAGLRSMSGILTESQRAEVIKRIERRDGIELLSEGQVTTLTERQAQIAVTEVKTIVTGISTNKDASIQPEALPTPLGPVLDVLPTVTPDNANIRLEVIPTYSEFVGYDMKTAEQFAPSVENGVTNSSILPLPIFRVWQVTHDTIVPDGRTLILGNLTATEITKQPNGEFKTTDVTNTQTNLLFVLITPTIIDPAGNRAKPVPSLNR